MPQVLYVAAHGGFEGQAVPLGGGAAVSNLLMAEWKRAAPFPVRLISPSILGPAAPGGKDIVRFSVPEYARFCRDFARAATAEVLKHDPAGSVVLVNDISEAPDFERLAGAGFPIVTIYHVDVVAYIADIYLKGLVPVPWLVKSWEALRRAPLLPDVLRLVFENQRGSVVHSAGIIVPSQAMKSRLLTAYPPASSGRIHVVPWGVPPDEPAAAEDHDLRAEFGVPSDAIVLLTLSRISPEKGQDLLLEALALWEREPDYPAQPVWLFVCGEAAFMQGRKYQERLKAMAARLRRTRVVFPGYVTGTRKRAFYRLADLYVFPSRHESFGLTLLEALSAGLPALCTATPGAAQVMNSSWGKITAAGARALLAGLREMLRDRQALRRMGESARQSGRPFSESAAAVAAILLRCHQ